MSDKIEKAIDVLASKIVPTVKADEAMKYTQAALNMAHTQDLLAIVDSRSNAARGRGGGTKPKIP